MRRPLLAVLLVLFAPGCLMTRYLAQAADGQLSLMHKARPISEVIADPDTDERTRILLSEIEPVKAFAQRHGLEGQKNYTQYVELDAPAVVWFVGASDPLSFSPRTWCFPIAGCFPGLGWFDREEARHFRDSLLDDGWDAFMRGADAFSTGGWFRDPVLSTMLNAPGDDAFAEVADVILHETVHATKFIPDQTYFNEGVATFVADALTAVWLTERFGADSPQLATWKSVEARRLARVERLLATYEELEALYATDASRATKLAKKAAIIDRAVEDLDLVRRPNNATLIELRTYRAGRGVFAELLDACGGDLLRLVDAVKSVKSSDFTKKLQEDLRPALAPAAKRCRAGAAKVGSTR
jgi:predicted aminopeptidase